MIKIAILGQIGSGKSFVSKQFGYPVFNADKEVAKIYKNNKLCYLKIKKLIPKFINSYPLNKNDLSNAILNDFNNLKKISKIIHPLVRIKLNKFLKKNKKSKMVVLDIPLYVENKLKKINDIFVFVDAKKNEINKRLIKRKNFNKKLINYFNKLQNSAKKKKKISNYFIQNNFNPEKIAGQIKMIKENILKK